jgi:hypothetical protein
VFAHISLLFAVQAAAVLLYLGKGLAGIFLPLGVAKRLDFQSLQNSGIHVVGNLLRLQHAWNPLRYLGFVKWDRAALLKCL